MLVLVKKKKLEIVVDKEKLRLKKLPNPYQDFVKTELKCTLVGVFRLLLVALNFVKLFTVLYLKKIFALIIVKLIRNYVQHL